MDRVRTGVLTPMFFGSAMSDFGVQLFLETFIGLASPPGASLAPIWGRGGRSFFIGCDARWGFENAVVHIQLPRSCS